MTIGLAAGRKLFYPSRHLWLRAKKQTSDAVSSSKHPWIVEIGLSARGVADIGDVTAVAPASNPKKQGSWFVQAGEKLVAIDWEAHKITSADELYHTVWDTVSEQTLLPTPISGVVEQIVCFDPVVEDLDEDTVVVQMRADDEALTTTDKGMMEEDDYNQYVTTLPPGKFISENV